MVNKKCTLAAAAAALFFGFSGFASADGVVNLGPTVDDPLSNQALVGGDTIQVAVSFVGDAAVNGYGGSWEYDPALVGVPVASAAAHPGSLVAVCSVDAGTNTFSVAVAGAAALADEDQVCVFTMDVLPATAVGNYPLVVSAAFPPSFSGGAGDFNPGEFDVIDAVPDVVLAFNPDAAVAFPGGVSGTTSAESIDVTVGSGAVGTGTVDNCVITGANAASFSVVGGDPTTTPPAGSIDLEVTLANSALAATLTCDVADAGAATTHVWALSAPAGTPVPSPEYSSNPAPGAELTCDGQPGSLTQTSVTITNTGFAGANSELDYSCSTASAGFSVISGAAGSIAVDASATVTVQCTVPAEDAPAATGTLDCTHDAANIASPVRYTLSSTAATAPPPVPQPNVVPASSLWSQLSLIGLLAALGLLVVGIRRNH